MPRPRHRSSYYHKNTYAVQVWWGVGDQVRVGRWRFRRFSALSREHARCQLPHAHHRSGALPSSRAAYVACLPFGCERARTRGTRVCLCVHAVVVPHSVRWARWIANAKRSRTHASRITHGPPKTALSIGDRLLISGDDTRFFINTIILHRERSRPLGIGPPPIQSIHG